MWRRFHAFSMRLARGARLVALTVGLFLTYVLGVGMTRLITLPLPVSALGGRRRRSEPQWLPAKGYDGDFDEHSRPS